MTQTIAIAGKGGVGKTTICGMLVDYLVSQRKTPVLVVDADANSNLNEVLGVEAGTTLGEIREEMAQAEKPGRRHPRGHDEGGVCRIPLQRSAGGGGRL